MPEYTVKLSKTVQKQLDLLQGTAFDKIIESIEHLAHNPRPSGYIKLKGRDGCRIRVGNYRIIYDIYDNVLVIGVLAIGDRKDIYR